MLLRSVRPMSGPVGIHNEFQTGPCPSEERVIYLMFVNESVNQTSIIRLYSFNTTSDDCTRKARVMGSRVCAVLAI